MNNLGQLMNQTTLRPYIVDDRPADISITRIKTNATFRMIRLRKGDVITVVNGRPVDTVEGVIAL